MYLIKPYKPYKPKLENEPKTVQKDQTIFEHLNFSLSYTVQELVDYCDKFPLDKVKLDIEWENVGHEDDDNECRARLYTSEEIPIPEEEIQKSFQQKLDYYKRAMECYKKEIIIYNEQAEKQRLKDIKKLEKELAKLKDSDKTEKLQKKLEKLKNENIKSKR